MRIVEGRQGKNNAGKLEAVVSVPDPSSCPLVAVLTPEQGVASWTSSCSSAWRVITDNPVGVASLQKLRVVWVLWRRSRPRIQSGRARRLGFGAAESIWTTQSQLQDYPSHHGVQPSRKKALSCPATANPLRIKIQSH